MRFSMDAILCGNGTPSCSEDGNAVPLVTTTLKRKRSNSFESEEGSIANVTLQNEHQRIFKGSRSFIQAGIFNIFSIFFFTIYPRISNNTN